MELIKLCCKYLADLLLHVFWVFPVRQNRLFIMNDLSHTYGGSPKYICEYLLAHEPGRYEIIYPLAAPDDSVPGSLITVRPRSPGYFYYALTSRVVVTNCGGISYLPVRKAQMVLNTWHGGGAYKRGGVLVYHGFSYRMETRLNAKKITYMMASTKVTKEEFPKALLISEDKMLETGLPRTDIFFTDYSRVRDKVYAHFGISREKRIAMYCPTFRSGKNTTADFYRLKRMEMDPAKLLDTLGKKFGGSWVLAERSHPRLAGRSVTGRRDVVDFSGYPDTQELLCAADLVISDFSSLIWDYSFTGNPCFIYADDVAEYTVSPGFYRPIEEWPYPVAGNFRELLDKIAGFDGEAYRRAVKQHYRDVGSYETGKATEAACRMIDNFCSRVDRDRPEGTAGRRED